jgi:hypothetical protein
MAEENIVFKVVADYDKVIKEWEELRDKVASTTQEYKECQVEINKLKQAKGELTGETFKSKEALQKEKEALIQSNAEYKRRQKELNNTFKAQAQQEKSVKKLTKAQVKSKDATGSATSATMELSRVISDAPYGIRGMANNITQLVSQLGTASTKAGGLGNALKLMGSQLMGPLGVVFAVTAAVSALDYFFGANKKAEESTSDFRQEIEELAKVLGDDLSINIEDYIKLLRDKKKLDEELLKTGDKQKELEDKLNGVVEYRLALEEKKRKSKLDTKVLDTQIEAVQEKEIELQSQITELYENAAIKVKEYNEVKSNLTSAEKDSLKGLKNTLSKEKEKRETLSKTSEKYKELTKDINETQKAIEAIEGKKTKKGSKISPFKTGKELELDIKSNESILLSYSNKIKVQQLKNSQSEELLSAKTAKEKDVVKRKYQEKFLRLQLDNEFETLELKKKTEKEVLEGKYKTFQEEAKLRLLAYEDSIKKNDKLSKAQKDSLIGSARTDTSKLLSDSFEERNKELGEGGTFEKKYESIFEMFNKLKKVRLDALGVGSGEEGEEPKVKELDKLQTYVEEYKKLMSGVTEFLDGEFERQLTIEQNKTNVLNKELNDRLINESLSAEQRKNIQNQIAQNDENLRVKQDAINKKKFKQTKALNLSMALIDTYAGAAQVLSDKELPSWAKIPMMVSIIGAGLAQVAAISRQKFQSSSAATPINTTGSGAVGGASERAEPSFNIVGRSNDNLLINAIQAQFGKPLKAYVVSRDVTTQQQLDGMIVGQAGT